MLPNGVGVVEGEGAQHHPQALQLPSARRAYRTYLPACGPCYRATGYGLRGTGYGLGARGCAGLSGSSLAQRLSRRGRATEAKAHAGRIPHAAAVVIGIRPVSQTARQVCGVGARLVSDSDLVQWGRGTT